MFSHTKRLFLYYFYNIQLALFPERIKVSPSNLLRLTGQIPNFLWLWLCVLQQWPQFINCIMNTGFIGKLHFFCSTPYICLPFAHSKSDYGEGGCFLGSPKQQMEECQSEWTLSMFQIIISQQLTPDEQGLSLRNVERLRFPASIWLHNSLICVLKGTWDLIFG